MDANDTYLAEPARNPPQYHPSRSPSIRAGLDSGQPSPTLHKDKGQSLRLRPADILHNAEPPSPLSVSVEPDRLRRPSKMSLFGLFTRPKPDVQTARAQPHPTVAAPREANASDAHMSGQVRNEYTTKRPASVASAKSTATKSSRYRAKMLEKPAAPPSHFKEHKAGPFEPPPLFQAYPQATKEGTLEVSGLSLEALNKAKLKRNGSLNFVGDKVGDRSSVETRRTSAMKYISNGSMFSVDLPKKIFVLVTSGYLLQYSEAGSSDRLPEKVLHLGKQSAAFACDLVPGKHYVLQVSQVVDRQGIIVASSGSIFSRLGMRSAAAKRMTNSFVLVLPNASEMESWMTAIRQEIEFLGGGKFRAEIARPVAKGGSKNAPDIRREPSHRYQVKRNPSKVTPVTTPRPEQTSFLHIPIFGDPDKSDTSTINSVEMRAKRVDGNESIPTTPCLPPLELTLHSISPPFIAQPIQVRTEKDDPVGSAQTSTQDHRSNKSSQSSDILSFYSSTSPQKAVERDLEFSTINTTAPGSLTSPVSHHQSVRKAPPAPLILRSQALLPVQPSLGEESPIIQTCPRIPPRSSKRPASASNDSKSAAVLSNRSKHDSKLSNFPPMLALDAIEAEGEENADTVGVLPTSPNMAASRVMSPSNMMFKQSQSSPATDAPKTRRVGSFSMPLRINPSAIQSNLPSGNPRRHSRMDEPGRRAILSVGLALTPPTDAPNPATTSYFKPTPSPASSENQHQPSPSPSPPSTRLSLFPNPSSSASSPSPMTSAEAPRRTSSMMASRQTHPQPAASSAPLRRPISMQVRRSDGAPFLASARGSTGSMDTIGRATAMPIRSMKRSRSTGSLHALPQRQSSLEALRALKFDTPALHEEEEEGMQQQRRREEAASPTYSSRSYSSRNSVRKSRRSPQGSLASLDFGITVAGLGPPAPPPRAPLPLLPPPLASGTEGAVGRVHGRGASMERVAGLGISV